MPGVSAQDAQPAIDLATSGGLLLAICLGLVLSFEDPSIVFLTFAFMMGIAPPLSAFLIYWMEKSSIAGDGAYAALRISIKLPLLWLLLVPLAYVALVVMQGPATVQMRQMCVLASAVGVAILIGLHLTMGSRRFPDALDGALIVAIGLAVFALSPFDPSGAVPIGLLEIYEGQA